METKSWEKPKSHDGKVSSPAFCMAPDTWDKCTCHDNSWLWGNQGATLSVRLPLFPMLASRETASGHSPTLHPVFSVNSRQKVGGGDGKALEGTVCWPPPKSGHVERGEAAHFPGGQEGWFSWAVVAGSWQSMGTWITWGDSQACCWLFSFPILELGPYGWRKYSWTLPVVCLQALVTFRWVFVSGLVGGWTGYSEVLLGCFNLKMNFSKYLLIHFGFAGEPIPFFFCLKWLAWFHGFWNKVLGFR